LDFGGGKTRGRFWGQSFRAKGTKKEKNLRPHCLDDHTLTGEMVVKSNLRRGSPPKGTTL